MAEALPCVDGNRLSMNDEPDGTLGKKPPLRDAPHFGKSDMETIGPSVLDIRTVRVEWIDHTLPGEGGRKRDLSRND
jgi:hypothetical protein